MANSLITLGPQFFPLSSVGAPAGGGTLYIGDVDTDPTVVGNQKTVYALPEDGILVQIAQPISLSAGGIPLYNGSPVSLYQDGDYSLTVLDINGSQVYYVPSTPGFDLTGDISVTGDLDVGGDLVATGDITGDNIIGNTLTIDEFPDNQNLAQFDGADGLEDAGVNVAGIGVLATAKEWTQAQSFNALAITSTGNAVAWNLNLAQAAIHTLTENTTFSAPSNMKDGMNGTLRIIQAAGVYTIAFNAVFEWGTKDASAAPAANGDLIILSWTTDGTNMYIAEFTRVEA